MSLNLLSNLYVNVSLKKSTNSLPYRMYLNLWFYSKVFRHLYFIVKNKMAGFFDKKDKADDENKTEQN